MPQPSPLRSRPAAHPAAKGRRGRVVLGLCVGLAVTLAAGLAGVAAGRNDRLELNAGLQQSGVLPVPEETASRAAAYWQGRLDGSHPGTTSPARSGASAAGSAVTATADPGPVPVVVSESPPAPPPSTPMKVSDPLAGTAFTGVPQVGAIFSTSNGATTGHYCSGSVVDSPQGDIVVTAAHCVADTTGYVSDIAFVPGFHDGQDPYGVWEVTNIVVPPQWLSDTDPDDDVAFLTVHLAGSASRVQDVVGGDQLGVDAGYTNLVQVVGYPASTQEPVTCTDYTSEFTDPSLSGPQLEFDCDDYPSGTSGSPFLAKVDSNTGLGTVIGVIGGFETGGDTPQVSYSVYFGPAVAALLGTAEAKS